MYKKYSMNSFNKTTCVQCKVYYGSEERMGMCSVCYKEYKNKEQQNQNVNTPNTNQNLNMDTCISSSTNPPTNSISTSSNTTIQKEDVKMEEMVQTSTRPVQTNPHACWICNKKVGYLGFKCKCEYIFCGTHRHFSDHNCDFDYKSYDRQKLVKNSGLETADNNKLVK